MKRFLPLPAGAVFALVRPGVGAARAGVAILSPDGDAVLDSPSATVTLRFPAGTPATLTVNGIKADSPTQIGRTETDGATRTRDPDLVRRSCSTKATNTLDVQAGRGRTGRADRPGADHARAGSPCARSGSRLPADGRSTLAVDGRAAGRPGAPLPPRRPGHTDGERGRVRRHGRRPGPARLPGRNRTAASSRATLQAGRAGADRARPGHVRRPGSVHRDRALPPTCGPASRRASWTSAWAAAAATTTGPFRTSSARTSATRPPLDGRTARLRHGQGRRLPVHRRVRQRARPEPDGGRGRAAWAGTRRRATSPTPSTATAPRARPWPSRGTTWPCAWNTTAIS